MADVRCPNCGKSNPEEAEKCLFCGEPLIIPENEQPEDSADWLSGLRSGNWQSESSPTDEGDEPADEGEVPDWLSRVRSRSQEETTPDQPSEDLPESQPAAGDDMDWLKSLGGDPGQSQGSADDWLAQSETEPAAPLGVSGEDWLSSLRGDEPPAEEPPAQLPDEPAPAAAGEEWLGGLNGWSAPLEPTQAKSEETAPEMAEAAESAPPVEPDWSSLSAISQAEGEGAQPPAEENLPDWLTSFTAEPAAAEETGEIPAVEIPEWLGSVPATPEALVEPSTPAEKVPDWLAGQGLPAEEPAPEAGQPTGDDLGWLGVLGAPEETVPSAESAAPEAFDLSALFAGETASSEALSSASEQAPDAETSPAETPAEVPDFSSFLGQETPADAGAEAPDFSFLDETAQTPSESEEKAPDFSGLFAAGALAASGLGDAEEEKPAETPDWMHDIGQAESEPAAPVSEPTDEVPSWMNDFGNASEPGPEIEAPLEGSAPFVDEELPAWLDNVKGVPAEEGEASISPLIEQPEPAAELSAPFQVELPDWLDKEKEGEAAPAAGEGMADEPAEELAKADLPSWVEDLRPLESVIPGDMRTDAGETVIEKAGPLAGMRGVLQSEDLASQYRKPPVYSARLRVTERQRSQAAILENLIGLETAPKQVSSELSRAPQMILRVVIALMLILSLLTMLLPDFRLVDPPATFPPGMTALYDRIENLPADSAVLLAFDYEPGLSGEMRYAANAVIEHLMVKNSRLAIVSTVPTGPILADDLLAEVHNRRTEYQIGERTVNLGYLPGGTTSLLEFAQNPKGATPSSLDTPLTGMPAWDHSAVLGLNSLQDFALVIVLTDSPETGRAWIEQVQPVLGSVPLTMITSAQAGPLLQPYYDSGQIQGMTSGLQGGALYEQRSGRVNLANRFWGAYQSGSLAGLLLLVIGGIISAVFGLSSRKPTQKGKA